MEPQVLPSAIFLRVQQSWGTFDVSDTKQTLKENLDFQMRNSGHSPGDNSEAGANVSVGAVMSFMATDYVQMYYTTSTGNNRAASPRNYLNIMKVGD